MALFLVFFSDPDLWSLCSCYRETLIYYVVLPYAILTLLLSEVCLSGSELYYCIIAWFLLLTFKTKKKKNTDTKRQCCYSWLHELCVYVCAVYALKGGGGEAVPSRLIFGMQTNTHQTHTCMYSMQTHWLSDSMTAACSLSIIQQH